MLTNQERALSQGPLQAFSRVFYNPPTPPIFVVEDREIERLAFRMPEVPELPYSAFVDDQGRVHFEINHSSFHPSKSLKDFVRSAIRPDRYFYELLRSQIIAGSVLGSERRIIGGAICTYYADRKEVETKLLGTLPPYETPDLDPQIRRRAINLLIKWNHSLMRWLGAERHLTTPCVIPVEKMRRNGWEIKELTLRERWEKFHDGLPMSLLKRQYIFFDREYEELCRDYPKTPRCPDCEKLHVTTWNYSDIFSPPLTTGVGTHADNKGRGIAANG